MDSVGETVSACNMPKPCEFPSLDSCQKRFLCLHKGGDRSPYPVSGLVLQVGDAGKFARALSRKSGSGVMSHVKVLFVVIQSLIVKTHIV